METIHTTPTTAGKGLNVAGFVIALVALVLWIFISGAAVLQAVTGGGMGLAIFWIIVSALGTALCVFGFMKAKAGNGKKGLSIAGLVIGLLATGLSVRTVFLVKEAHALVGSLGTEMMSKMEEGLKNLEQVAETAAATAAYKTGDKVQVLWKESWYPAEVLEVTADGQYKIHYDGFDASYDETVGTDRMKL
jgi:hypothetical protein